MDYSEYLQSKKIDEARFKAGDPDTYEEFRKLFGQMHPKSFTMQKLYLINGIRREYPLPREAGKPARKAAAPRPKIAVRRDPSAPEKATGSSPQPVRKPRPLTPGKPRPRTEEPDDDLRGKSAENSPRKPRPVIKPATGSSPENKSGSKPVIKPKIPEKGPGGQKPSKPLMKPRIPKKENSGETAGKPKPVIRPRRDESPGGSQESSAQKEGDSKAPKKPKKPIIKPRKKED